jgi:hypothetical protein
VWCVDFHREGGIYRGEWDLHRLGEVSLVPGGGWAAKPRGRSAGWSGLYQLCPLTPASPPHVDTWQPRLRPNHLKPWTVGQGVGLASWPLGLLGLGSGPLGPRVKYTAVVMMILTFGKLHFAIP